LLNQFNLLLWVVHINSEAKAMDIFGGKTQKLLADAQNLLQQAQQEMSNDIEGLKANQNATDARLARLETQQDNSAREIGRLQKSLDDIRDSAIRGEVASGQKTKDVAEKFNITPARVSQIAPRRKYNNG
jgi:peptidoglycan hydrolase CwlO-like protein